MSDRDIWGNKWAEIDVSSPNFGVGILNAFVDDVIGRLEALTVPMAEYAEYLPASVLRPILGTCQNILVQSVEDRDGYGCFNVASISDKDSSLSFCVSCWKFMQGEE